MTSLIIASMRGRVGAYSALVLTVLLGTVLTGGFASLIETGAPSGLSAADAETLTTMGAAIGSWGAVLVFFTVISTVTITVRQRHNELTQLRTIGATNGQIRAFVCMETSIISLLSAIAGLLPGWFLGRILLRAIGDAGMVDTDISHAFGLATATILVCGMVALSAGATALACLRVTRQVAASVDDVDRYLLPRSRVILGSFLVLSTLVMCIVATVVSVESDDPWLAMQLAGSLSIAASVGLGVLAPPVLRLMAAGIMPTLGRNTPVYLATRALGRRTLRSSAILLPVVVFVGVSVGGLTMMLIHNTVSDTGMLAESDTVELLNYVVVGIIALFAGIMVVTTVTAAIVDRERELSRLRLVGVSHAEALWSITVESILVSAVGALLGVAGSLATIFPIAIARLDSPLTSKATWIAAGVVGLALILCVGTAWIVARRTVDRRSYAMAT